MTKPFILLVAILMVNGCSTSSREMSDSAASPIAAAPTQAPPPPPLAPEVVPPKAAPPAKTAAATPAPSKPAPVAVPAKAPPAAAPPSLDLKTLESRLRGSSAIGVMTKLALKNQVDDLVKRFKAYHDGSRPPQLAELRPSYELLVMKFMTLLQDKDAALAKDINASREAIWGLLADREKLSQFA
ncbi:hypothetical protein [Usitatibacter palustris]|uniref:Uncharacterized protein n=1 Tax=Usitatibacter palustris TaxID=2732487 RepID=A0A6M4HD17_9PROT|nr:hypothetical protein [Usitatibacter palustris]QJR15887.1 hypothetical protein DSM104440_02713 [Usitatibacter palustris]